MVILLFINVLGGYSLNSMSVMDVMVDDISGACIDGLLDAQKMTEHATNARLRELNILSQTDRSKIAQEQQKLENDTREIQERIKNYFDTVDEAFYSDDEEKQADLDAIGNVKTSWEEYLQANKQVIDLHIAGNTAGARAMMDSDSSAKFATLIKSLNDMNEFNVVAALGAARIAREAYNQSKVLTIVIQIATLLFTIGACYVLYLSLKRPVDELARVSTAVGNGNLTVQAEIFSEDELGTLSREYNNTIKQMRELIMQIQHTAQQLAASSQQLTASAEQSSHATQSVAQNAASVSEKSGKQITSVTSMKQVIDEVSEEINETTSIAGVSSDNTKSAEQKTTEGMSLIKEATSQMQQIESSVNNTAKVVEALGQRSSEIGSIIETISAISSQTNLLALNAAIEAARAGEHGRGFSVVADEVRKLAEQSQESTEKIAGLIQIIQRQTQEAVEAMKTSAVEVENGSKAVAQSGSAFSELAQIAGQIGVQVNDIAKKMNLVLSKTGNIITAVNEVQQSGEESNKDSQLAAQALEEQSASIEEIAAASNSLAHLAEEMQTITQKFRV